MPQIKNPVTIVQSGGGATRPTTWAEFAAMTSTEMQQVYGVGDRVGIACPWTPPLSSYPIDFLWEIAAFGTTKKENDNTDYPCVTLVARYSTPDYYQFDAPETRLAATEETAQDGIYYFGYNGSTYTALNLSAGDTIPYGDYTAVYKTDVTNNVSYYGDIRNEGYNVYKYSAIRQWLNSDADANNWWQASHVGDAAPNYADQRGFMSGFGSDFKGILQRTEVKTAGNSVTDDGSVYTTYDYFFLPSAYELGVNTTLVEGDRMRPYFGTYNASVGLVVRGRPSGDILVNWWERTNVRYNPRTMYCVITTGSAQTQVPASGTRSVVPACKIILAGN